jgi:hypothetical protein
MATFSIDVAVNSKSVNELEQDLQSLETQFKSLKIGDPGFTELGNKIKGVRSQLKDVELQFEGLDKEQRATALVDTFNGLTGAVGAVSSAFIAFGAESQAIEEAEKKLLGVIGVVSGLRDVSNSLIAANKLVGSSLKTAFTTATGAINVTRVALAGLGIGALIFAVTELADAFDLFGTKAAEANEKAARSLAASELATKNAINVIKDKGDIAVAQAELEGKSEEELLKIKKDSINDQLNALEGLAGKQNKEFKRRQDEAKGDQELLKEINDEFSKQAQANIAIQNALDKELALLDINFKKGEKTRKEAAKKESSDLLKEETKELQEELAKREAARVTALDQTISAELSANETLRAKRLALAETEDERIQIEYQNKIEGLKEAQIQEEIAVAGNEEALALIRKKYADLQIIATQELDTAETNLTITNAEKRANLLAQIAEAEAVSEDERRALEKQKLIQFYDDLIAEATKNGIDITALNKAKNDALAKQNDEFAATDLEKQKAYRQQIVDLAVDSALSLINDLKSLNQIFDKDNEEAAKRAFNREKALASVQTVIETYLSAAKAYTSQIIPLDPTSIVRAQIAAGVAVASGLARLAVINSQKFDGNTSSGNTGAGGGGGAGAVNIPPSIPTSQGTFTPILPEGTTTIGSGGAQTGGGGRTGERVVKTYVLAGDVTDAQQAEAQINQKRKF